MELREEIDNVFNNRISKLIQRQKNKGKNPSRHDAIEILKSMQTQVRSIFETFEILSNPEILKGLKNAMEDYKEGRFETLTNDDVNPENKENHSQQCKKGEGVPLHNSLEPRSKAGEGKETVMPVDVDNHSADTNLSKSGEVKDGN